MASEEIRPTASLVGHGGATMRICEVTLRVLSGAERGRVVKIEQPTFTIGSAPLADLRIADGSVSREHLRLNLEEGGVRLRDESSKNGTFVDGARIRDVTYNKNVVATLGKTELGIELGGTLELAISDNVRFGEVIGTTPVMRELFARLEKAAASDLSILLEGESGVGKDAIARAIHAKSGRAAGPFVVADCSAIPRELIESELFGHRKGAFTGADADRAGLVEEADGGTLFLDEVGELTLEMQPKLLRVLEQREVRRVGANEARPVDIRVIAATNRRLTERSRSGEFRSDLFFRLAVVRATIPPLRDRLGDVLPIAKAMLRGLGRSADAPIPRSLELMLEAYHWPGNVRELRNVIERYLAFGADDPELFEQPDEETPVLAVRDLAELTYHEARRRVLERFDSQYLPYVLHRENGVMARAAERAGVARQSFYEMMKRVRGH